MESIDMGQAIFDGVIGHSGALAVTRSALKAGDVHILFEGPPGCGKSALLLAIENRIPGTVYRDGKSLSASKLRDRLKEDPSIFIIDEIDALDSRAYDELALPLEHGRVQKDTTQESYDIQIGTQMIAACNDQRELPENIRSRFRTVKLSDYTDEDYLTLCGSMLPDIVEWVKAEEQGREIGRIVMDTTGETDPRDARDVARLAGDMDQVPSMAKAFINPDAEVESDPITPKDVKRAQPELGKRRLAEMASQESQIRDAIEKETQDAQEGEEAVMDHFEAMAEDESGDGEGPSEDEVRDQVEQNVRSAIEEQAST